jgi:phospholipid/cholesterol/gamma-HCH transport system substrate-binding protein
MVGLVVMLSLVALAWMILRFSSAGFTSLFSKGMRITMRSERVDGLNEGSPVLYLGVNVGHVVDVRRQPDNQRVEIGAIIDSPQPLPANVHGMIRQQSQLGNASQIVLETTGDPSGEMKAGEVIEARYLGGGMIPPEFAELAAQARDQKLVLHLDEMITSIQTQLERSGKLMDSLNTMVGDPDLQGDIKTMVANLKQTSERFNQFSTQLNDLAADSKTTMTQLRTTVGGAGERLDQLSKNVNDRLDQVAKLLEQAQAISVKINKGEGTAGQLVNDPRLYESMVDASKELNETIKTLRRLAAQWEQEGISIKALR